MSTLQITLPGASFPSTFPKAYPDPILVPGSLMLLDFSNAAGYDGGSAIPVDGTMLPNLAYDPAATLLGSGNRASLSPVLTTPGLSGSQSATHKIEWTGKKGLHLIVSPGQTGSVGMRVPYAAAIRDYMFANLPGRLFYLSIWRRLTRIDGGGNAAHSAFCTNTGVGSYYAACAGQALAPTSYWASPTGNIAGTHFTAAQLSLWTGTKPGAAADSFLTAFQVGGFSAWASAAGKPSQVLYRLYLEDLNASGRTFAQVKAIDEALYVTAFGIGGKYYNDTYTDPAVIS